MRPASLRRSRHASGPAQVLGEQVLPGIAN